MRSPKRRRRAFLALRPADLELSHEGGLFLGRFDAPALRVELEQAGVFSRLAQRGYAEVDLRTDYESREHRLRIEPRGGGPSLVDVRLAQTTTIACDPLLRARGIEVLSFLSIHWLALQDPSREFTPDKPRLPGQAHPGLGLSRRLVERVRAWAESWGLDGLLNFPEYFHNAIFYSPDFRFLSAARQGRFEALARDLGHLHVAAASHAVEQGRVVEGPGARPSRWETSEMVGPVGEGIKGYLESAEYRRAVAAVRDTLSFRLAPAPPQAGR